MSRVTETDVMVWLEEVKDPEIPVLSLIDLGVITAVSVENTKVHIEMTPTFVGCPALDVMKEEITALLRTKGCDTVTIDVSFRQPWSSDKISEKGKAALKKFGLAPPPPAALITDLEILASPACPHCNGTHTELRNTFGSTLCRALYYCHDCRQAFEQFKPL